MVEDIKKKCILYPSRILSNADNATNFWRFVVSAINVNAKVYYKTTNLLCENISEPSLIRHITLSELKNFRSEFLLFLTSLSQPRMLRKTSNKRIKIFYWI